jgi:DNA polymerase/3'-5' exonuclease PolX
MGVCRGPSGIGRRIDIRFVQYICLGAALLYFTGSGKFNKIMRYHANTRGFTLNEYGLYSYINGVKGDDPIPATTEQDIFKRLGFVYLSPEEREF